MTLHRDASRFAWLPGDDRQYDLGGTLDDATSAVYSGFLVAEEGTALSFRALSSAGCRRSSPWPASRRSRRRWRRPRLAALSLPSAAAECAYCAPRRNAWSTTTIPSNGASHPADPAEPIQAALCARHGAVHEYPTGARRCFTGHIGWPITTSRETYATAPNWPREPLRQPACEFVDNAVRCPQPHRPNHHRSGRLMRHQDRSTWRVSNIPIFASA
jgi:hypothetical protein